MMMISDLDKLMRYMKNKNYKNINFNFDVDKYTDDKYKKKLEEVRRNDNTEENNKKYTKMKYKKKLEEVKGENKSVKSEFKKKLEEVRKKIYKLYYDEMDKYKKEFYNIPVDVILYKIFVFYPYNCGLYIRYQKKYDLYGYFKYDKSRTIRKIFRSIIEHHKKYLHINFNKIYTYHGSCFDMDKLSKNNKLINFELAYINRNLRNIFRRVRENKEMKNINDKTFNMLKKIHINTDKYRINIYNCKFPNLKSLNNDKIPYNCIHTLTYSNYFPKIENIKLHIIHRRISHNIININNISIINKDNFLNLKHLQINNIQYGVVLSILSHYEFPKLQSLELETYKVSFETPIMSFNEFPNIEHINLQFGNCVSSYDMYRIFLAKQTYKNLKSFGIGYSIPKIDDLVTEICKLIPFGIETLNIKLYSEETRFMNHTRNDNLERIKTICNKMPIIEKNITQKLKTKTSCVIDWDFQY